MVGIGMLVGGVASPTPDLEATLVRASIQGMERGDLRVLAVLVTWFGVHAAHVNADRLTRFVAMQASKRVRAFWSALARWRAAHRRFFRMARAYRGPRLDLLEAGTEFQVARRGEDPRFTGSKLRVPANVLRDRPARRASAGGRREVARRLSVAPRHRAHLPGRHVGRAGPSTGPFGRRAGEGDLCVLRQRMAGAEGLRPLEECLCVVSRSTEAGCCHPGCHPGRTAPKGKGAGR